MKKVKDYFLLAAVACLWVSSLRANTTDSCQTQVFFSHKDKIEQKLIDLIQEEKTSIQIAVYQLKAKSILAALIQSKKRSKDYYYYRPKIRPDTLPIYNYIKKNQLDLYIWKCKKPVYVKNESTYKKIVPKLHNKFILFGNNKVWTGSCNFSKTAFHINAENALLISCPSIVEEYQTAFNELLKESYLRYEIEKSKF